jgi:hypothetical protein
VAPLAAAQSTDAPQNHSSISPHRSDNTHMALEADSWVMF